MDTEREYWQFVLDGRASEFIDELHSSNNLAIEEGDTWDDAKH